MRQGGRKLLAPEYASRKGGDSGIGQHPKRCPVQRGFVSLKESSDHRDEGADESSVPCIHLRLLLQGPNAGPCESARHSFGLFSREQGASVLRRVRAAFRGGHLSSQFRGDGPSYFSSSPPNCKNASPSTQHTRTHTQHSLTQLLITSQ